MAQLAQCLCLNLADTFTGYIELLADFLQSTGTSVLNTKAQTQHLFLTGCQGLEHLYQLFLEQGKRCSLSRLQCVIIRNEIPQMAVLFLTNRSFQRNRLLCDLENFTHTLYRHIHFFCNFLRLRIMSQLLQQLTGHTDDLVNGLNHVYRNTNGTCLIRNRTGNCLTNPPGSIGGEFKALGAVELLNCLEQAQIAFLNQIKEQHTAAYIPLGNRDNQTQIGFRQTLLCIFTAADCFAQCLIFLLINGFAVLFPQLQLCHFFLGFHTGLHFLCQFYFFFRGQQVNLADLLQIHTYRVINRKAFCQRLGILQLFLCDFFHGIFRKFLFAFCRNSQNLGAFQLDTGLFQLLIQSIQLIRLHVDGFQRIRHFLQRELTLFLALCKKLLDGSLLFYIHVLCHL